MKKLRRRFATFSFSIQTNKKYFLKSFDFQIMVCIFVSVFHRILDFTRGWISIRPLFFYTGFSLNNSLRTGFRLHVNQSFLLSHLVISNVACRLIIEYCLLVTHYFFTLPTLNFYNGYPFNYRRRKINTKDAY
jgi:hypothetical protein